MTKKRPKKGQGKRNPLIISHNINDMHSEATQQIAN